MERDKGGKLELRLEDQVGIDYGKHLYFPLYLNSYEDALRSIFLRVLWINDSREATKSGFTYVNQDKESNIVSFIGARGSGKTTAMMEFSQIIKNLNEKDEKAWWIGQVFTEDSLKERMMRHPFFFKVLDPIDASNLEEKEDLFEMVMTAIYREYVQAVENSKFTDDAAYGYREMLTLFDEIITGYHAIKNSRDESFGDSYIPRLKYMSTSMDINKKMKRLIGGLLKAYQNDGSDYSNSFLVISVDDLDLNIRHGYEMLEQLRKYFFQTNIIITLSGDYDQFNRICKYHYVKEFSEEKSHVIEEDVQENCKHLALDYILKTMPINARVFMPSLETMTRNVVVGREAVGVKQFVMTKIAETMGIFYDIKGLKIHFLEPRTVRELVNYNQFLESLWEIDFDGTNLEEPREESGVWMNHYDQNHERFNQDIMGRIANILLDEEHRKVFDEWSRQNLERRVSAICDTFWKRIWESHGLKREYDGENYAYGEMLEGIYRYGRISDEDKQLVKCVLASLSSEMVREKVSWLRNPSEESRSHSQKRLDKFIGITFGSSWLSDLVPLMETDDYKEERFGYRLRTEAKFQEAFPIFPEQLFFKLLNRRLESISKDSMRRYLREFERWLRDKRVIPTLECLAMFYEPVERTQSHVEFHMWIDMDESSIDENWYLFASGYNKACHLDVLGFIKKTLNYKENYEKNCESLAHSLSDMLVQYILNHRDMKLGEETERSLRNAVREIVMELSIHHKYPWKNSEGAAFPFYDLDLSYNIMKRTRIELLKSNPSSIPQRQCYRYIVRAYRQIIAMLEEQEEIYKGMGISFPYGDNFKECPFVKAFLNADEDLKIGFKEELGRTIYNTLSPVTLEWKDYPGEETEDSEW